MEPDQLGTTLGSAVLVVERLLSLPADEKVDLFSLRRGPEVRRIDRPTDRMRGGREGVKGHVTSLVIPTTLLRTSLDIVVVVLACLAVDSGSVTRSVQQSTP